MTDPLLVRTDDLRTFADLHARVGSGLSGLTGSDGGGVQRSHGAIASAVSTALQSTLDGRAGTVGATSARAGVVADLLEKAARAYAAGDEEGADRLRAAAAVLEGAPAPETATGPAGAAGTAAGGTVSPGADAMAPMGQILGQVGQQVGQLAQLITAPLQGLMQGLQQVPQQILQAAQAAQAADLGEADLPETEQLAEEPGDETERDSREERPEPVPVPETRAGESVPSDRAPVQTPAPARPAPTRPQVG